MTDPHPSSLTTPALQSLLLDLISPARPVPQSQVDLLSPADWRRFMASVRQHRLGPLLHWQLGQAHAGLRLPDEVSAQLARSHRAASLRSLQMQGEWLRAHRLLAACGIPCMALKGAGLAWRAYPHPALRPLRDLDLLVPAEMALRAYEALLQSGLSRDADYPGDPAAFLPMDHHLPPLASASGKLRLELHTRLFHRDPDDPSAPDLSEAPGFWQRAVQTPMANTTVCVQSPTDLLLHLIVHAVHDHEFSNGPLLLSDMAFLMQACPIDWPLFWSLAARHRQTRACALALAMVRRYWGSPALDAQGRAIEADAALDERIDLAAQLMLRDTEALAQVNLRARLAAQPGLAAQAAVLLRKLFPPRDRLAARHSRAVDDWRVLLLYPVEWYRLAVKRLPDFVRVRRHDLLQPEALRLLTLRRWLREPPVKS